MGLDISASNLAKARETSAANPPVLVEFIAGSARRLPCADESFDAVVCECAVSTFPDQPCVLAEFARVLKPGGVVGMSDLVVEVTLPDDIAGLIAPWTCLAAARSVVEYQSLFLAAGLRVTEYADESAALRDMVVNLKRKLLTAGLARSLGAIPGLEQLDVRGLRDLLRRAEEVVSAGTIQYARMTFSKGRPRFVPRHDHPGDKSRGVQAFRRVLLRRGRPWRNAETKTRYRPRRVDSISGCVSTFTRGRGRFDRLAAFTILWPLGEGPLGWWQQAAPHCSAHTELSSSAPSSAAIAS